MNYDEQMHYIKQRSLGSGTLLSQGKVHHKQFRQVDMKEDVFEDEPNWKRGRTTFSPLDPEE